jgi:hemerythrin-like domain-containing protein
LFFRHLKTEQISQLSSLSTPQIYKILAEHSINTVFIDIAVDFIRTYADRTHHSKEEDILFRELAKKQLSPEHKKTMEELVDEHAFARKTTGCLGG